MTGWIAVLAAGLAAAAPEAPSRFTRDAHAAVAASPRFADTRDFDFAARGFVATRADPLIKAADGRTVWDLSAFDFLQGAPPPTVNPSLWRQGQLLARHGLFQVTDRVWQVRGFDIANITFVKGDTGWIVIDTLGSTETAAAALALVDERLGKRPIVAIIYTHSHADHYGGAGGLVDAADVRAGKVRVIAPPGFLTAAVGENIIAGPAMQRRATYQFGVFLPKGPGGTVNSGIGPALAIGTPSLVPPNLTIEHSGQHLAVDGVELVFQLTPGTEAPAEMNIDLPGLHVLDMAENANATQHNILTPRGAVVRDAHVWAEQLSEAIALFPESDVLITSHAWPRFGRAVIADYLAKHRDAYAYLHDQTVRLMNRGYTGAEIAARLQMPEALAAEWYDRPYYGSLSFNSRAVYQFYMGWYDADPAHLVPLPPAEAGARYVAALGGPTRVRALARAAYDKGDYAWAAELLDKAVFAGDAGSKDLLARCYDQLGWQSENALWRNIYLSGARELRDGVTALPRSAGQASVLAALPTPTIFDLLAVRLDAEKAGSIRLAFVFPERSEATYVTVANGVLIHRAGPPPGPVDATLTVRRADLLASMFGGVPLAPKVMGGEAKIDGDPGAPARFAGWFDPPRGDFPIVTPRDSIAATNRGEQR